MTPTCTEAVCNERSGNCEVVESNLGAPCDDRNPCTMGESCESGACVGGTPVTTCTMTPDGCCPPSCNHTNDADCTYVLTGTARLVNGGFVPVQYELCGTGVAGACTGLDAQAACAAQNMRVVSHASDGSPTVFSLEATTSCQYSISYFTVNQAMPSNTCLTGISSLHWATGCCGTGSWIGNTVHFAPANQTFGWVHPTDSGYVASNPNVYGTCRVPPFVPIEAGSVNNSPRSCDPSDRSTPD